MKTTQDWKEQIESEVSQIAVKYDNKRDGKNLLPKEFWTEVKKYIFTLYFKSGIVWSILFYLLFLYLLFTQNFSAFFFWLAIYILYLGYLYFQTLQWTKSVKKNGVQYLQEEGKGGKDLL